MRLRQKSIAILGIVLGIVSGCGDCRYDAETVHPAPVRPDPVPPLIESAKSDLASKDYHAALQKCLEAEQLDDTLAEAKYCILLANLGALVMSVEAVVGLFAAQLSPAEYQAGAFNVKQIVSSILSDIEDQMRYIDIYAAKLAAFKDPTITLDAFPIHLDLDDLNDVTGDSVAGSGEVSLNLRGTWDKSEVMLLGAAVNGVQGVLDYLLSHKLVLHSTDFDFDSTEGVARLFDFNPNLLVADPADKDRIDGDDDKRKGLKNDILAMLSFFVGRDSDLEHVGPKHGGLVQAIKESAEAARPDAIIQWLDIDSDGYPEKIRVPALEEALDDVNRTDGPFENPLSKVSWNKLVSLGKALRDNIEHGSAPVALRGALQALADDMRAKGSDFRLAYRPVPDIVALDLHAFLKAPPYLSDLVPYYFTYTTATTAVVRYDLAFEVETYDEGSDEWFVAKGGFEAYRGVGDFAHFSYDTPDEFSASVTVAAYDFGVFAAPPMIAADGISPDTRSPQLYYVALQDPGFGGLFTGDPTGQGDYGPLDSAAFNRALARLVKYYCIDLSKGVLDSLNNSLYVNNDITTCTGGF